VTGDGEASTRLECLVASVIRAGDIDKLENIAVVDGGDTTVHPAARSAAIVTLRELVQREPEVGDGRLGLGKHIAEEDASAVVDPAQPAADRDDRVSHPKAELLSIKNGVASPLWRTGTRTESHLPADDLNKYMSAKRISLGM